MHQYPGILGCHPIELNRACLNCSCACQDADDLGVALAVDTVAWVGQSALLVCSTLLDADAGEPQETVHLPFPSTSPPPSGHAV